MAKGAGREALLTAVGQNEGLPCQIFNGFEEWKPSGPRHLALRRDKPVAAPRPREFSLFKAIENLAGKPFILPDGRQKSFSAGTLRH